MERKGRRMMDRATEGRTINRSSVVLKKVASLHDYASVRDGVNALLDDQKGNLIVPGDATVLIKVNLCLLLGPETGATVDPRVALAIIEWLKANYRIRKVYIAEADATQLSADMAFKGLGWKQFFQERDPEVAFCNLSTDTRVPAPTCYGSSIAMSDKYMNSDLMISLAKLKTHSLQQITCTMKNLFGALPEKYKVKYHPRLTQAICEFASARKPHLSIIDGLVGMDGKGPVNGVPKVCGILIAGNDMVATDHFCATVMGFRPKSVPYIAEALRLKLGSADYDVRGDSLGQDNLHFKLMPTWEYYLRKIVKGIRETVSQKHRSGSAPAEL